MTALAGRTWGAWRRPRSTSSCSNWQYCNYLIISHGPTGNYCDCRANLGRLAEAAIDFELLEAVVLHIDATQPEGAVLVFLPGAPLIARV